MKAAAIVILLVVALTGCGDTKVINGVEYDTYGLFDEDENRNPKIKYELIEGNVVWSVLLLETAIAPIYFIGYSLWEPVGLNEDYVTGEVGRQTPYFGLITKHPLFTDNGENNERDDDYAKGNWHIMGLRYPARHNCLFH